MENATLRALRAASDKLGGVTDYRLAKELGFSQQALSRYRQGMNQLDDHAAVLVAKFIGMNPAKLLAEIAAERTKDEGARSYWLKLAKLAPSATLSLAILAAGHVWMADAQRAQALESALVSPALSVQNAGVPVNIMSNDGSPARAIEASAWAAPIDGPNPFHTLALLGGLFLMWRRRGGHSIGG